MCPALCAAGWSGSPSLPHTHTQHAKHSKAVAGARGQQTPPPPPQKDIPRQKKKKKEKHLYLLQIIGILGGRQHAVMFTAIKEIMG